MIYSVVSRLTGNVNQMEIPLSYEEIMDRFDLMEAGTLIQNAFPELNSDQREFLLTGATPEEWDEAFGEEE